MFSEQEDRIWQEAYEKAKEELKMVPPIYRIATGRRGFSGSSPVIYIDVPIRGQKVLVDMLVCKGWRKLYSHNVQGKKILEMSKAY